MGKTQTKPTNKTHTMELKIRSPRLPCKFLLPFFIILNSPLPVLLPLNVLASFLRIRSRPERLCKFALLLDPYKVARCNFGP